MEVSAQLNPCETVMESRSNRPKSGDMGQHTFDHSSLESAQQTEVKTALVFSKASLSFFLLGLFVSPHPLKESFLFGSESRILLVPLICHSNSENGLDQIAFPTMVVTTAANEMFAGITGAYGICLSLTAAVASFGTPLVARYLPYNVCTAMCTVASLLSYVLCTVPRPLDGTQDSNKAGPVIGTMLAGFVYAFGTNTYMAIAAFAPSEAILGLSIGSGFSSILGPGIYIGVTAAFQQEWKRTLLVCLPTALGIPAVWIGLVGPNIRHAAENSRLGCIKKLAGSSTTVSTCDLTPKEAKDLEASRERNQLHAVNDQQARDYNKDLLTEQGHPEATGRQGFGHQRTRTALLFKTIIPKYTLPLFICTSSAIISLFGTAPTVQELKRFRAVPQGDLQFQLVCRFSEHSFPTPTVMFRNDRMRRICVLQNGRRHTDSSLVLSYGSAQFISSTIAGFCPLRSVWALSIAQLGLTVIGIVQLFHPFLTYYGVWVGIMFLVGGCVGAGITFTNHKIAADFRRAGEPDEVRSFAMSYAGLGNFGGDALGGALGIVMQTMATRSLTKGATV